MVCACASEVEVARRVWCPEGWYGSIGGMEYGGAVIVRQWGETGAWARLGNGPTPRCSVQQGGS